MDPIIQSLRQEITRLRQEIALRPIRVPTRGGAGSPSPYFLATIVGGNVIAPSGYLGVNLATVAPVSIPDYDLTSIPSTVDGVGVARRIDTGAYILVAHYKPFTPMQVDIYEGQTLICGGSTPLLITGSSPAAYKSLFFICGFA
jgi:hypothetical protein